MDFTKKFGSRDPKHNAKWVAMDDAEFLIAPLDNLAYQQWAQSRFSVAQLTAIESGDYSAMGETAADVFDVMADGVASTVLLDWKGLEKDGAELAYSKEAATELLSYSQFLDWVLQTAGKVANENGASKAEKEKKIS